MSGQHEAMLQEICVLVDADACPVKDEAARVATRHGVSLVYVANRFMRIPHGERLRLQVVSDGFDAADDWIVEQARPGSVVVTADIPLASRALSAGAVVMGPGGKPFTDASIGMALATRNIMEDLRAGGAIMGGPPPFSPRDRSAFLSALDLAIVRLKRAGHPA